MARLVFRGVAFTFGGARTLFDDVTLRLDGGVIGVAGENGGGKTTLLRLAAGELEPDRGVVRVEPLEALVVLCPQTVEVLGEDVRALAAAGDGEAIALRDRLGLDPASLDRWSSRCRPASGAGGSSPRPSTASPTCSSSTSPRTTWTRTRAPG